MKRRLLYITLIVSVMASLSCLSTEPKLFAKDTEEKSSKSTELRTVYLMNKGITSCDELKKIPHPEKIGTLNVSHNDIKEIPEGALDRFYNLRELDLGTNKIEKIHPGAFKKLTHLEDLHLYWNELTTIKANTFTGLSNLNNLTLNGNKFTHIQKNAFNGLSKLQLLILSNNQSTEELRLEEGAFFDLSNLRKLNLSQMKIIMEKDTFTGLSHLKKLDLYRSQITMPPNTWEKALAELPELEEIYVKGLRIVVR